MRLERLIRVQIQDILRNTAARVKGKRFHNYKHFRREAEKDFPWDRKTATNLRTGEWDALVFKLYMILRQKSMIKYPWYSWVLWGLKHTFRFLWKIYAQIRWQYRKLQLWVSITSRHLFVRGCDICGCDTVFFRECKECRIGYKQARADAIKDSKAGARKTPG